MCEMVFSIDTLCHGAYDAAHSDTLHPTSAYTEPIVTLLHVEGTVGYDLSRERRAAMPVTVFINEVGMIVVANPQGGILTEGFFRTEEETEEALEAMGYRRLLTVYPAAEIVVGTGIDPDDLSEIFLESARHAAIDC